MTLPIVEEYKIITGFVFRRPNRRSTLKFPCPHCKAALRSTYKGPDDVDECPDCGGSFLISPTKLANALEEYGTKAAASAAARRKGVEDRREANKAADKTAIVALCIWVCIIAIPLVVGGIIENLTSSSSTSGTLHGGGSKASGSDDEFAMKYVCRKRLEERLRDPSSLKIIEERVIHPGRNGGKMGYYAKYRAKNGFGGYAIEEFYTE